MKRFMTGINRHFVKRSLFGPFRKLARGIIGGAR
jgi:hypothetical protein